MNKLKSLAYASMLLCSSAFAQKSEVPKNWHQLDLATTGFNGISLQKAYDVIKTKKLKSKRVIVAVIDSGIDTLHEDLKPILWTNPNEIVGNGIDDDKNGYIDDVHGWNFIGGKDGRNLKEESLEAARVYYKLKAKWDGKTVAIYDADKRELADFKRAEKTVLGEDAGFAPSPVMLKNMQKGLMKSDTLLQKVIGKETFTGNELEKYETKDIAEKKAKATFIGVMKPNGAMEQTNKEFLDGLAEYISSIEQKEKAKTTPPAEKRKDIVGDDETNFNDRSYGNNDIMANTPFHGTHCAGIIAAARNNGKGVDGIADNVRIMMLRCVPDGDEHDKDIAMAIRYAVDNGAQIISMSFGKDFSPEKQWVDDAFRYAESDGFLGKYSIVGLHENYISQNVLVDIYSNPFMQYTSYEDIFLRERKSFMQAVGQAVDFTHDSYTGIELDLDAVQNTLSSAHTPSGISALLARQYITFTARHSRAAYLHICEGASQLSDGRKDESTGKLISYLVSDFVKGMNER